MTMHFRTLTQLADPNIDTMQAMVNMIFLGNPDLKKLHPILRKEHGREYWMLVSEDQCTETHATHHFSCPSGTTLEATHDMKRYELQTLRGIGDASIPKTIFQKNQRKEFLKFCDELLPKIPA